MQLNSTVKGWDPLINKVRTLRRNLSVSNFGQMPNLTSSMIHMLLLPPHLFSA